MTVQIVKQKAPSVWMQWLQMGIKRPLLILAPAVIAVVLYVFVVREPPAPRAADKPVIGTGETYGATADELGERQRDLIDSHNDQAASKTAEAIAAGAPAANVANIYTEPEITASPVEEPAPAFPQPRQPAGARQRSATQNAQQRQLSRATGDYAARLYGRWATPQVAATYATTAPQPVAPVDAGDAELPDLLGIEIGKPVDATLVVGANSDAPGALVAEIYRPRLRLIGGAKRTAPDQITVEFDLAVTPDGRIYNINAQALDPQTGSAALQGKVKRHLLRNLTSGISGVTLGFLGGYSAGVRSNPGSLLGIGLDTDLALRATAAQTLQAAVPRPRDPTVTVDAGTPILVLLTKPPRVGPRSVASVATTSAAAAGDVGQTPADPPVADLYTSEGLTGEGLR